MSKYNDPLYIDWHRNVQGREYSVKIENENHKIIGNKIFLVQIPDIQYRVVINGKFETEGEITSADFYKVNYENGMISFHTSLSEQSVVISQYYGRGVILYPASRIWTEIDDSGNIVETLGDIVSSNKLYWRPPVTSFVNISTTYPVPSVGWTVQALDTKNVYRWDGDAWIYIQNLNITVVNNLTQTVSGKSLDAMQGKILDDKIGISLGLRISVGNTQPTDTVFWLDTSED